MKDVLEGLVWVVLGSAIGGPTRYFVSGLVGRRIGETFPWGTVIINASGAFFIGMLAAVTAIGGMLPMPVAWQFAATGFLGSYTTVSSFSQQTLALVRDGQFLRAGGNVTLSLLLCLSAVALGYAAGSAMVGASA